RTPSPLHEMLHAASENGKNNLTPLQSSRGNEGWTGTRKISPSALGMDKSHRPRQSMRIPAALSNAGFVGACRGMLGLHQHGLFGHSHVPAAVVFSTRIAEKRPIRHAIFRGGVRLRIPALGLGELAALCQALKQVLADVLHPVRLTLLRVAELVNPDRLRHVAPPGRGSTVA